TDPGGELRSPWLVIGGWWMVEVLGEGGGEVDFDGAVFDGEPDFSWGLANDLVERRKIGGRIGPGGGRGHGEDRVAVAGILTRHRGSLDRELAGEGSIAGGEGQVHQDQLDAAGIGLGAAGIGPQHQLQPDVVAERALQQIVQIGDQLAEIQIRRRGGLALAKFEQTVGQARGVGASAAGFQQAAEFLSDGGGQAAEDLQTVRGTMIRRSPGLVGGALARGTEQQAYAHGVRIAIPHGRDAALDGLTGALPAEQQNVVPQADGDAFPKHSANGGGLRRSGPGIENGEDFTDRFAESLFLLPTREGLGYAVHQRDLPALLGDDYAFIDTADGGGHTLSAVDQLAFAPVAVEGELDGGAQGAVVKRFQDITGGRGLLGALQDFGIGVGGEVNHGDLELVVQRAGHIDTIQNALQLDIHQDQIRHGFDRQPESFRAGGGGSHDFVSQSLDTLLYVGRDNLLILH